MRGLSFPRFFLISSPVMKPPEPKFSMTRLRPSLPYLSLTFCVPLLRTPEEPAQLLRFLNVFFQFPKFHLVVLVGLKERAFLPPLHAFSILVIPSGPRDPAFSPFLFSPLFFPLVFPRAFGPEANKSAISHWPTDNVESRLPPPFLGSSRSPLGKSRSLQDLTLSLFC